MFSPNPLFLRFMNRDGFRILILSTISFFLIPASLNAQNALTFERYCDSLKQLTSSAKYDQAEKLLPVLDSLLAKDKTPEKTADALLHKAYFQMFKSGDSEDYEMLTEAARIYEQEGLLEKRNLAEAYQCVSLYLLKRLNGSLAAAEKLIKEVPKEEEEARGWAHNIAAAVEGSEGIGHPHKGIHHIRQALPYFKKIKADRRLISLYGIMASCYNNLGQAGQALIYIDSSAYFAANIDNLEEIAFLNIRKARAYQNLGQYQKGIDALLLAEAYYLNHGSTHRELEWIYGLLRDFYLQLGDKDPAIRYSYLKDSLVTFERENVNDQKVSDLMVLYETEKKEHQIQMQALTIENQEQRNRQLLITSVSGLAFLIALAALVYVYFTNRQKEKLRQTQLEFQEKLLRTTVHIQEAERKRIARDLHDGIGQQLSGLKMGFQRLAEKMREISSVPPQQLQYLDKVLTEASDDVRNLSHQMMPKALQELGLDAAIGDLLEKSLVPAGLTYEFDPHGMEKRLPEDIEVGVYRIVQELLSNILKHANAREVEVALIQKKGQVLLIVEDDGKGFSPENRGSSGHGLTNIQSRLQAIGGTVNFESQEGQGTVVTVRVALGGG